MGANASGKTTLGKALMGVFNFLAKTNLSSKPESNFKTELLNCSYLHTALKKHGFNVENIWTCVPNGNFSGIPNDSRRIGIRWIVWFFAIVFLWIKTNLIASIRESRALNALYLVRLDECRHQFMHQLGHLFDFITGDTIHMDSASNDAIE